MGERCLSRIGVIALFFTQILFGVIPGYTQQDGELDIDLSESTPFNPNSAQDCYQRASETKSMCEKQARANNTDPATLKAALKECALRYGETRYLVCHCLIVQPLRCQTGARADCNKDYHRCIVLAEYLKDICLQSGRPTDECRVERWRAEDECVRLELECVAKIPPKKPATMWR